MADLGGEDELSTLERLVAGHKRCSRAAP
jgi:hypothetical protein